MKDSVCMSLITDRITKRIFTS
jgi:DNA-binding protein HU-beta